jgi:RNA polymerase sigma factor for flagellar operon FliA
VSASAPSAGVDEPSGLARLAAACGVLLLAAMLAAPANIHRDRLITDHVEIARRIALHLARRCPAWITRDDLVAAGMLGLIEAADRYDTSRVEPFLAFAEKRIRGAVLDELRRGDIMPRRARQLARKIGKTIQQLETLHGRAPSDDEIAVALGVELADYRANLEQLVHVSVGVLSPIEEARLVVPTDASPEAQAAHTQAMARVRGALHRLPERDVLILGLYYNEELTYTEIGHVLAVTPSRVCQLHGRAIARLRAELEPQLSELAAA